MNEQHKEFQPPMELPRPQVDGSNAYAEKGSSEQFSDKAGAQAVEQGTTSSSLASQSPIAVPAAQPSARTQPRGMAVPADDLGDTSTLIADDVDLIEKEWVHKAKEIVEQTKTDPHIQNKKMNEVKAGYLKKRYNKELKLSEDQ